MPFMLLACQCVSNTGVPVTLNRRALKSISIFLIAGPRRWVFSAFSFLYLEKKILKNNNTGMRISWRRATYGQKIKYEIKKNKFYTYLPYLT